MYRSTINFYLVYARKSPRHNWNLYGIDDSAPRVMDQIKHSMDVYKECWNPGFQQGIKIIKKWEFSNFIAEYDNLKFNDDSVYIFKESELNLLPFSGWRR